jgi:hypothetical protein
MYENFFDNFEIRFMISRFLQYIFVLAFVYAQPMVLTIHTNELILDQNFYLCAAKHFSLENNTMFVVPYSSNQDFVRALTYASRAGFVGLHLLIHPDEFITLSSTYIAETISAAMQEQGLTVFGIWLKVSDSDSVWTYNQSYNTQLIVSNLQLLGAKLYTASFTSPVLGLYTTTNDLRVVSGFNPRIPQSGFKYWSALGDNSEACQGNVYGFQVCYMTQTRNVTMCANSIGVNVMKSILS